MHSKLAGLAGIVSAVAVALVLGLSYSVAHPAVDADSTPRTQHSVLASDEGPGAPAP